MKTPSAALREALRVLGPSDVLLVPTYCHAETEDNLERYLHWASKSGHKSYHLFTGETLSALVADCGFAVEERVVLEIGEERQERSLNLGYVVARKPA